MNVATMCMIISENGKNTYLFPHVGVKFHPENGAPLMPADTLDRLADLFNTDMRKAGLKITLCYKIEKMQPEDLFGHNYDEVNLDTAKYISKYKKYFSKELINQLIFMYGKEWEYKNIYYTLCIGFELSGWDAYDITEYDRKIVDRLIIEINKHEEQALDNNDMTNIRGFIGWIDTQRNKPKSKLSMSIAKTKKFTLKEIDLLSKILKSRQK